LRNEIAPYETTPILVGHSLGCLLIEIVLAEVPPPAAVLLAPTRHDIFRRSVWEFFKKHPFRFLQLFFTFTMWPPICTPELCREMLFSPALPEADLLEWHGCLQNESYKVATQLLWGCGPKPAPPSGVPTLVVVGDHELELAALAAADRCLKAIGYIALDEVFREMGKLGATHWEDWRFGRFPYLERVIRFIEQLVAKGL